MKQQGPGEVSGSTSSRPSLNATDAQAALQLDLRGLHCPMPVLHLRKALRQVAVGTAVEITCTDPLTTIDIPHAIAEDSQQLAWQKRDGSLFRYRVVRLR